MPAMEMEVEHLLHILGQFCILCSVVHSVFWEVILLLYYIQALLYKYTKQNVTETETKLLPFSMLRPREGRIAAVLCLWLHEEVFG